MKDCLEAHSALSQFEGILGHHVFACVPAVSTESAQ